MAAWIFLEEDTTLETVNLGRRRAMQTLAAGAAGLTIVAYTGSAFAQEAGASSATRKMIVRIDDVGLSEIANIGAFETIHNGVATSADVMLDCPGTDDALRRLKELPWISVGWHMHMWGTPVLPSSKVSTLIEKEGEFAGRFRTDLYTAEDVSYDEAVAELRAQLENCVNLLGRVPDTAAIRSGDTPWSRAVRQVVETEFDLPHSFAGQPATTDSYMQHILAAQKAGEEWASFYPSEPTPARDPIERWADRKIVNAAGTTAYVDLLTDSVSSVEANYDPVLFYTEDRAGILKYPTDTIITQSWHPGYLDYYAYRLGERNPRARAQQFVVGRVQDVAALCDPRLKEWIKENGIELINFRDALYRTRDYQNHLRVSGSELAVA